MRLSARIATLLPGLTAVMALGVTALPGRGTAADLAFVTSQNAEMVTLVDLAAGKITAQVPVAGAPAPVAYDPAHGRAFVVSAKTGRMSVLDETGAHLLGRDLGEGAFGVAAVPGEGIFVTDWYGQRLVRLNQNLDTVWSVATGAAPAGVALSADGALVATADRDDDQVSIFDAVTGRKLRSAKVGIHPYALAFHDSLIWTTDVQSDTVSVVDPFTGRLTGTLKTGSHPYGIAFAGGRGFVTNQYAGTITVFDPETLTEIATLETGDYPEGIAALPDDSGVVVVHWESNTMTRIDAASLEVAWEIELPDGPRAFGLFTGRQR